MLILAASTCLLATVVLATSEPDAKPVAHFLANGTWAHPDIAPSYFSGRSPMAPVPLVPSGLASTYLPQQHPQYVPQQHPQYVQPQQQYLPQQQHQYVDSLLARQPQIVDRRLAGATLSYENGMYGTRLAFPHRDHAATAGGIYTSSGMPIHQGSISGVAMTQGSIYPTTQAHAGSLLQGHYTSPVIAARLPQGQVLRNPLLVTQNYPVSGRRVNQVPMFTSASQADHQGLTTGYLNQPICTNAYGAQIACF